MRIQKYIFNHKTLRYEKFKVPTKKRIVRVFLYLLSIAAFSFLFVVLFYGIFGSPRERMQARELEYMKLQYEILSDKMGEMDTVLADLAHRDDDVYRVIFEADPIPVAQRRAGFGGADRYQNLYGYKNSDLVVKVSKQLDMIASQLYVQSKSYDEVFNMALKKTEMLKAIPSIIPVDEADIKHISSFFGYRPDPIYKVARFHSGVDLSADLNTPVHAAGDGTVLELESTQWGYGNIITIDHGYGYKTRYAHLQKFAVATGQKVKRGQLIGYVGSTGKSTGAHLHYEVLKNDVPVDPMHFFFKDLDADEFDEVRQMSALPLQTMD